MNYVPHRSANMQYNLSRSQPNLARFIKASCPTLPQQRAAVKIDTLSYGRLTPLILLLLPYFFRPVLPWRPTADYSNSSIAQSISCSALLDLGCLLQLLY